MKIVLFTHEAYSHVNGIKKFIEYFSKTGVEIMCYVSDMYSNLISENENVIVRTYNENIEKELKEVLKDYSNLLGGIGTSRDNTTAEGIINEVKDTYEYILKGSYIYYNYLIDEIKNYNPDIIIRDACSFFARKIGDSLNIPILGYTTSITVPEELVCSNKRYFLELIYNIDLSIFDNSEVEQIYYRIKESMKQLSDRYEMRQFSVSYTVDPDEKFNFYFGIPFDSHKSYDRYHNYKYMLFDDMVDEKYNEEYIYISSGSGLTFPVGMYNYFINFLNKTKQKGIIGFKYSDAYFIKYNNLPENIKFEKFVNQIETLKSSKLFISHGGYNSILEAIYYNVPLIIIPICSDQFIDAAFVENKKIGFAMDVKKITSSKDIIDVYENYKENKNKIKDTLNVIKEQYMSLKDYTELFNEILGIAKEEIV